ncbi:MAG: TRAP transporter small permease [Pseudomonadales bacterium]
MLQLLKQLDSALAALFKHFLVFALLALTALMAFAVFLRYVLDQAIPAIEELSVLLGLWIYFIAFVVVTRERSHLTGGILDLISLSSRQRALIKGFNDLVGLCIVAVFGYYAYKYLFFTLKINRSSTNLAWPTAWWVGAAVTGFSLMGVYKLRDLFNHSYTYNDYDNKSPHASNAIFKE